eukprot:COSAG04_NODE_454_length_14092_cov_330.378261_2_plen_90_part_00
MPRLGPLFRRYVANMWPKLAELRLNLGGFGTAPGAKACLSLDTFAATPSLVTSDHKPVFARFKLTAPPAVHPQPEAEALLRCGHNKPPS